jgi:hypothetical protein
MASKIMTNAMHSVVATSDVLRGSIDPCMVLSVCLKQSYCSAIGSPEGSKANFFARGTRVSNQSRPLSG